MNKKILTFFGMFVIAIVLDFSSAIFSPRGSEITSIFTKTFALEEEGEKKDWYYFDCPYTNGQYCKTVKSDSFCGRAKNSPISACPL
ncbi:hypothetical protein [Algoriphagus antarcticus]|uniref:Uncharacterized protein n=1 Tax=Algoriphagus antarcticus TaxID=238540 RepID=A0A3E0DUX6_9BACT|nr:hypothetical protein [Algoriphagus antarcticus]REG88412.1 hypothetical protein C8N25_10927 [Algoriphagus antarcticus]